MYYPTNATFDLSQAIYCYSEFSISDTSYFILFKLNKNHLNDSGLFKVDL